MVKVQFFTIDVSWFIIILRPNYEGQNLLKKNIYYLIKKFHKKKRPKSEYQQNIQGCNFIKMIYDYSL